tara:strand:+ start:44 stop:781 length:738 start_codon:yes stop_codon:yes gene_type:complete
MKTIDIREKLKNIGMPVEELILGDFDQIGEYTAKKTRSPKSELYRTAGCFFRPNYERGLLIYSLIKKYNLKSFLEIGFGRGFVTVCAAKALQENGGGKIVTIDPLFEDENTKSHVKRLIESLPREWFSSNDISFVNGFSQNILPSINENFDFVYIDGDHTYEATKKDWLNTKDKFNKFLLFDDYHLTTKKVDALAGSQDIECAKAIDEIDDFEKELIIMDRRIFFDDRRIPDEEIDYGQVLIEKK